MRAVPAPGRRRGASPPTNTTASGCRWTRSRTASSSRRSTRAATRPGRSGTATSPARARLRRECRRLDGIGPRIEPVMLALNLRKRPRPAARPVPRRALGRHRDRLRRPDALAARESQTVDVDWVVFSAPAGREREARRGASLFLKGAATAARARPRSSATGSFPTSRPSRTSSRRSSARPRRISS